MTSDFRFALNSARDARPGKAAAGRPGRVPFFFVSTFILINLIVLPVLCAGASAAQKRTLARRADPVIVKGSQAQGFTGKNISDLRLYAFSGSGFKAIPYQVDERDRDGRYVFKGADGRFDARDELVFMAKDTGGETAGAKVRGAAAGAAIQLTDPVGGGKAFVYLFAFERGKAPERSAVDYARCDRDCNFVDAANYAVGFSKEAPLVFDNLTIKKTGGGPGTDVLDRLKVRFHGETKFGITIDRNEDEFTSELTGVIDGPVRVIRETSNRMILYGKLPTPSAVSEQIFYYNSFEFPVTINVPLRLSFFLKDMRLTITSESSVTWGSRFYNANNRKGVSVDGRMSPEERKMNRGAYEWQVVAGGKQPNTGAWLNRLIFDKKKTPAKISLHYVDDAKSENPPDGVPGQIGNLGYVIGNIENLRPGRHVLRTFMYNLNSYRPGDEIKTLNILDRPLKVSVKSY